MKYIAKYPVVEVDAAEAQKGHQDEYYRKPHGFNNGKSLGRFVETKDGICSYDPVRSTIVQIGKNDKWLKMMTADLFTHLKANANLDTTTWCGINGFILSNSLPKEVLGDCWKFCLEIGAGYTAFISQDGKKVLAESYVACSGNTVVVIHKEDESILYVNSRRHGIPCLASVFQGMEPHEVVMYDSMCTENKWFESDLKPVGILTPHEQIAEQFENSL